MNNKKQQLQEVRIEDFNIALLKQAAREGRLFIAPEQRASCAPKSQEQLIGTILSYVQPIACYSSNSKIGDLWNAVLHDPHLSPLFFFSRYSSSRGRVNWYRVTALVCLLREWGIYRNDITATRLHCILEGTSTRTNRYTGMSRYLFEHEHIKVIREILHNSQL